MLRLAGRKLKSRDNRAAGPSAHGMLKEARNEQASPPRPGVNTRSGLHQSYKAPEGFGRSKQWHLSARPLEPSELKCRGDVT